MACNSKIEITASSELSSRYTLKEFLGEGQYGTVWRCEERTTGEHFALKYIDLTKCSSRARLAALSEVEILQKIRDSGFSDSVVSLKEVYGDNNSLYLVMELCTGGDLLELIQNQPGAFISEAESRHVFASVARAVKQCHASSIVHRDIKPENILICPNSKSVPATAAASDNGAASFSYTAKLADFGLAVDVPWLQQIRGYAGSKPYEAPEVMAGVAYDESADIWSLGVTLYAMLSGKWPLFSGGKRVLDEKADFASDWKNVSGDAKDLIRRMLCVDVNERFTIDDVLAHPWVRPAVEAVTQEAMETADLSDGRTAAVDSDTAGSMSSVSATNSMDSDFGSNAEKPRWGGKVSPRTVLNRVKQAFSPLIQLLV
ncbi:unnamed protein product [Closterium sp. NIES-64]|nr:unnamed protein product [Closterium sp. NIES-64]